MVSWLLTVLVTGFVLVFSLMNRQDVEVNLWPFNTAVAAPTYFIVLISLLVGILLGGISVWLRSLSLKNSLRRAERDLERTQKDLDELKTTQNSTPLLNGNEE